MKNINKIIFISNRLILVMCIVFTFGCKDDAWDKHYQELDNRLESDLLSVLSSDSEYSTFVELLKQTDYYSLLEASQAFTVWAPNNTSLQLVPDAVLNDPDLLKQLIGNHISSFSYNSSFIENQILVKMLNGKYIEFSNSDGSLSFGDIDVVEKDILTANGILHKVANVLNVNPNIWDYLNENETQYPILMDYLKPFNATAFDLEASTPIGTDPLGQTVYDSVFTTKNTFFKTIGDLSSEEERFTFVGLTDEVYSGFYESLKGYFKQSRANLVKSATDSIIFRNLNFPIVEDLNGTAVTNTVGNDIVFDPNSVSEIITLSNGTIFMVDELNYEPKNIVFKPVRYEVENADERIIGSVEDLSIQKKFDVNASDSFTNVVSLTANPDGSNSNNFFEITFDKVVAGSYKVNVKFTPVGAAQDTKLKFEFTYIASTFAQVKNEIPAVVINKEENGILQLGGGETYDLAWYVDLSKNRYFSVKLKVIVDVSEAELLLYDRKFGIDYIELIPAE